MRDTIWLNYLGHHIHSVTFYFISIQRTGSQMSTDSIRCPAIIEIGKYEIQTWYSSPYPPEYSRYCGCYKYVVFFCLQILACVFSSVSLKYNPELFLLSSSDYKSFICVSSVWSTWEAKTSSRDTQRNVAGSTHQPMKSTGKMTFLYLRLAPLYHNKAIAACCMWLRWMDSGVVVEGRMGARWEKKSLFFLLHSMFRLMEMSANSSAKTSACWPSFSWITRPCIMMWSLSSSTFWQRTMRKAVILWVIFPR